MVIFENVTKEQIKIRVSKGKKGVYSWKSLLPGEKVDLPENYASSLSKLYGGKENVVEILKEVSVATEKKEVSAKKEKVVEKPKKKEPVKKSLVSSIKKAVGMK